MSGWTIHSTHGQLDPRECIRFNLCQERQSASWVPFHPTHELFCSCSLQYSEPSLASVLYSLLRVFIFFFFYHLSLLGVLGPPFPLLWVLSFPRLFLLWLNTLHKPEATVTLLVKNQERQKTREEEGSTVSYHSWKAQFPTIAGKHSSLRRQGRHCQDQPRGGLCQPLTCGAVKFQQGLGRGVASQRSDLATAGERRGTFVLGVSLILR